MTKRIATTTLRPGWKNMAGGCLNATERAARLAEVARQQAVDQACEIAYASRDYPRSKSGP